MEETKKPTCLYDCLEHLNKMLIDSEDIDWFRKAEEEEAVVQSHHGLGKWIRDNWGLESKDTELYDYFAKLGLQHPDDISSVILTSYHRQLNKKKLNLDAQITHYIKFWKNQKLWYN